MTVYSFLLFKKSSWNVSFAERRYQNSTLLRRTHLIDIIPPKNRSEGNYMLVIVAQFEIYVCSQKAQYSSRILQSKALTWLHAFPMYDIVLNFVSGW